MLNETLKLNSFFFDDDFVASELQGKDFLKVFTAGKNLRAQICTDFGRIFNVPEIELHILSRAAELVHNATLCHDDVIDQSEFRRNHKTSNAVIGNKKAVLLGDYILAKTLVEISELGRPELITELSLCLKKLVDGEWIQEKCTNPFTFKFDEYKRLAYNKTSSLFVWALKAPLLFQSASEETLQKVEELGNTLGLIFQIQDDIIDFSKQSKKQVYTDLINNNPNFVFSSLQDISQEDIENLLFAGSFEVLNPHNQNQILKEIENAKHFVTKLFTDLDIVKEELCEKFQNFETSCKVKSFFDSIFIVLKNRKY
jgi:geranylgeranyl pyrophosphate synthase